MSKVFAPEKSKQLWRRSGSIIEKLSDASRTAHKFANKLVVREKPDA